MRGKNLKFNLLFFIFLGIFGFAFKVQALTIAPALIKLELAPGESQTQKIYLFNETNQTVKYYPTVENFVSDKNTNTPIFLGNNDPLSAARWFTLSQTEIELKSGEKKIVVVNVKAPLLAEPGGHYVGLLFSDVPPQSAGVKTANRLATLFLLTVKGEIKEDLQVASFNKIDDNSGFDLEIENKGNVHLQPTGQVTVINGSGQQVALIPINNLKQNILPQSRRTFGLKLKETLPWGKYTAKAQLYFGKDKILESQEINFWQWPQNLFVNLLSVLAIILVILVIFKIARKRIS